MTAPTSADRAFAARIGLTPAQIFAAKFPAAAASGAFVFPRPEVLTDTKVDRMKSQLNTQPIKPPLHHIKTPLPPRRLYPPGISVCVRTTKMGVWDVFRREAHDREPTYLGLVFKGAVKGCWQNDREPAKVHFCKGAAIAALTTP